MSSPYDLSVWGTYSHVTIGNGSKHLPRLWSVVDGSDNKPMKNEKVSCKLKIWWQEHSFARLYLKAKETLQIKLSYPIVGDCQICTLFANSQFMGCMAIAICECSLWKLHHLLQTTTKQPINSFSYLQCLHSHREDLDYYWVLVLVQSCVFFLWSLGN